VDKFNLAHRAFVYGITLGSLAFLIAGCGMFAVDKSSDTTTVSVPVLSRKLSLGGNRNTFVIDSLGSVKVWGSNYDQDDTVYGILGVGDSSTPGFLPISTLDDSGTQYLSVSAGEYANCGLTSSRRIKCWGRSTGDGTTTDRPSPVLVNDDGALYSDVAAGSYHSCGVTSAGVLRCWGDGWDGKLGTGNTNGSDSPTTADSGTLYTRVSAGRNHTCAITVAGVMKCWGTNDHGQIGHGNSGAAASDPVVVDAGVAYKFVAAGQNTSCGITLSGVLKCWGQNADGQIGDGSSTDRDSPVTSNSGTLFSQVSLATSSGGHTCGLTEAGGVLCWGSNSAGQVGDTSSSADHLTGYAVDSGVSYVSVAAGYEHSCGVTAAGVLKCWGGNTEGELGLGDSTTHTGINTVGSGY